MKKLALSMGSFASAALFASPLLADQVDPTAIIQARLKQIDRAPSVTYKQTTFTYSAPHIAAI